jgi:hypothetical protein
MSKVIHLTKVQRLQVEAIEAELKPWGLRSQLVNEGKHMCLKVFGPKGGCWRITFAGTPRDEGSAVNISRQKAKRLIRDINARAGL